MGGVDRADEKVALHWTLHQTTKWWKKVFFPVLETAVVSASKIYKKLYNVQHFDPIKFRMNLVEQLIAGYDKDGGPNTDSDLHLIQRNFLGVNPV